MKVLSNENFKDVIREGVWLVDFSATWCGPCKMLEPVLEEINYTNTLKVDVDAHQQVANNYGVMSIPTMIFFKDGKEVDKIIGFTSKEEIEQKLDNIK